MGLMDMLNQVTQGMNDFADKLTGEANKQFDSSQNRGIEGLGNINKDNANGCITEPGDLLKKNASNAKLLETNMRNFVDNAAFSMYLQNLLQSTGQFQIVPCEDGLKQTVCNDNIFYAQCTNGVNYLIMSALQYDEAKLLIGNFVASTLIINNVRKVMVSYFNFDEHTLGVARNGGIEVVGINEFMEINSLATSSILPDLNFGASQNSFKAVLGRTLKSINTNTQQSANFQDKFNDITKSVDGALDSVVNKIEGAFGVNSNIPQNTQDVQSTQNIENTTKVNLKKDTEDMNNEHQ